MFVVVPASMLCVPLSAPWYGFLVIVIFVTIDCDDVFLACSKLCEQNCRHVIGLNYLFREGAFGLYGSYLFVALFSNSAEQRPRLKLSIHAHRVL